MIGLASRRSACQWGSARAQEAQRSPPPCWARRRRTPRPPCGLRVEQPETGGEEAGLRHGTKTADIAGVIAFAMNPLYRADPEREWPAVATSAYWADR